MPVAITIGSAALVVIAVAGRFGWLSVDSPVSRLLDAIMVSTLVLTPSIPQQEEVHLASHIMVIGAEKPAHLRYTVLPWRLLMGRLSPYGVEIDRLPKRMESQLSVDSSQEVGGNVLSRTGFSD